MSPSRILSRLATVTGILLALCTGAIAERRALVIGNGAYLHWPKLEKAHSDAEAMRQSLTRLGFSVTLATDLDAKAWDDALARFQAGVSVDDEVVVFYSGHGLTAQNRSLLIPVDETPPTQAMSAAAPINAGVDDLVDAIQAKKPRYVFLVVNAADAPRPTRPSAGSLAGTMREARRLVETDVGAFILFAAREQQPVLDRLGDDDPSPHSVFTRVLLKHLETPGLTLSDIASRTRNEVRVLAAAEGYAQSPAYFDTVLEGPVLNPDPADEASTATVRPKSLEVPPPLAAELPPRSEAATETAQHPKATPPTRRIVGAKAARIKPPKSRPVVRGTTDPRRFRLKKRSRQVFEVRKRRKMRRDGAFVKSARRVNRRNVAPECRKRLPRACRTGVVRRKSD